jgi:hypothetical protein
MVYQNLQFGGVVVVTHAPIEDRTIVNESLLDPVPVTLEGATWAMNAAHMAQIALQLPGRVAIHARAMLPPSNALPLRITKVRREIDRVLEIGGVDAFGEPWRMSEEEAIAAIRAGARSFYVEAPGGRGGWFLGKERGGREYLSLPEPPA